MPSIPMNIMLEHVLPVNGQLTLPYPEGRNEGHFFGGTNHTLSIEGTFFRSPKDFSLITQPDRITFVWNGKFAVPAGSLLNLQIEMPGGETYFDTKAGVSVQGMVLAPLFMVNLASPDPAREEFWVKRTAILQLKPLTLVHTKIATPRNVVVHSSGDNSHATFIIEGEDLYRRVVVERITCAPSGKAEGNKAFARIKRITPTHPCNGDIWIGTGNKLGLPVYLPFPGYVLREIIGGISVTGGQIVAGDSGLPSATSGDRRGTYTPPPGASLENRQSIHLLISLLSPGNIGTPDYTG